MKALDIICMLLLVVGGLNLGVIGLVNADILEAILGTNTFWIRFLYILIGASGLYTIFQWRGIPSRWCSSCNTNCNSNCNR